MDNEQYVHNYVVSFLEICLLLFGYNYIRKKRYICFGNEDTPMAFCNKTVDVDISM